MPSPPVIQRHARLMVPTCVLPSIAHAVAVRIGGMKNGRVIRISSTPRPGVSVRATIHAIRIASVSDSTVFTNEISAVLASACRLSGASSAR